VVASTDTSSLRRLVLTELCRKFTVSLSHPHFRGGGGKESLSVSLLIRVAEADNFSFRIFQ
jgi:hypothetical protein